MNCIDFKNNMLKPVSYTESEIWNQPDLWGRIYEKLAAQKDDIELFINEAAASGNLHIILTGAGSSAFIGLSLIGAYSRHLHTNAVAVSTTDLVTHPKDYIAPGIPILLISFSRSGDSPESVAAINLVEQFCKQLYHLIITCDGEGSLAKLDTKFQKYVFLLPTSSNDRSLAMTGSYSGMLLAGLLIARIKEIKNLYKQIAKLKSYGQKLLRQSELFNEIAKLSFERAVFLGSGALYGTATESHLKIQELTDGKIICKNDSFLGFRHGPKAVIDNKTLVFLLFSNNPYVLLYEADLVKSLKSGMKPLITIGLIESKMNIDGIDKLLVLSNNHSQIDEDFLPVCFIMPAQIIGFYKSIILGLNPDMPSKSGSISRVVTGVNIYPLK